MPRDVQLAETFVQLADSLVDDFDLIDLLTVLTDGCVEVLDAATAAILLADGDRRLRVMAASDERATLLELFQLQNDEGPCLECVSTGQPVLQQDLATDTRWPRFSAESVQAGFLSVAALPLRLRGDVFGALNLFLHQPQGMTDADVALAQAMADVASVAMVQDDVIRGSEVRVGQLQHALDSRVVIEQAKGMLSEHGQLGMDEAFGHLRSYARRTNSPLTGVARDLVGGRLQLDEVVTSLPHRPA